MENFRLHFAERSTRKLMKVNTGEAHRPCVPDDVHESDAPGPALDGVHPVPHPGIVTDIYFPAIPDVETVERVEQNRQPDAEKLEYRHQRKARQEPHLAGVSSGPADRSSVGNENMFEQEGAYRNDA